MPLHRHAANHETIVVFSGRIRTDIAGQVLLGSKGDVLLYPAGQDHHEQAVGDEGLETCFVAWAGAPAPKGPLKAFDRDGRMGFLARWLAEIATPFAPEQQRLADSLLEALLAEYQHCVAASDSDVVLRVKRYVQANLARPLALEDLAAAAGLSKFHFARVFAVSAGVPPMQFVRRCRTDAARMLLQTTPLPLKAIASQVGFANEYHLCRVFRQVTGVSPGSFRKRS